jgi:hypothetical protein
MMVDLELGSMVVGGLAIVAWFTRLERRFGRTLSREEHEHICDRHQRAIAERLGGIERILAAQDKISDRYRDQVLTELRDLAIDTAVLQDRIGVRRRRRARESLPTGGD